MAPPLILLLFFVLVVVVAIVMLVAGIGPFAQRKAHQPRIDDRGPDSRPLHDIPHSEQFAREKWRMFPPAR